MGPGSARASARLAGTTAEPGTTADPMAAGFVRCRLQPHPPLSSRRKPGPIPRDACFEKNGVTTRLAQLRPPVVMSPRFRGGDNLQSRLAGVWMKPLFQVGLIRISLT